MQIPGNYHRNIIDPDRITLLVLLPYFLRADGWGVKGIVSVY